jgi:predicted acylesterase/phospholipase RssA
MKINKNETYSLVLSGGGALGILQLSVLKELVQVWVL